MSEIREGDTIKTDNTIAAALLTVKLREANALIDTLVEALDDLCELLGSEECREDESGNLCEEDANIVAHLAVAEQALAEAKKWKGEV
jgi:hypothetical protein